MTPEDNNLVFVLSCDPSLVDAQAEENRAENWLEELFYPFQGYANLI